MSVIDNSIFNTLNENELRFYDCIIYLNIGTLKGTNVQQHLFQINENKSYVEHAQYFDCIKLNQFENFN